MAAAVRSEMAVAEPTPAGVSLSAFLSSARGRAKGRATQGVVGSIPRWIDTLVASFGP